MSALTVTSGMVHAHTRVGKALYQARLYYAHQVQSRGGCRYMQAASSPDGVGRTAEAPRTVNMWLRTSASTSLPANAMLSLPGACKRRAVDHPRCMYGTCRLSCWPEVESERPCTVTLTPANMRLRTADDGDHDKSKAAEHCCGICRKPSAAKRCVRCGEDSHRMMPAVNSTSSSGKADSVPCG